MFHFGGANKDYGNECNGSKNLNFVTHMPNTTFNSAGCPISDLQSRLAELKKFAQRNVELVPDTMELLTDTELTQYFFQTWSLDYTTMIQVIGR